MATVNVTKQSTGKPNTPTAYTFSAVGAGDTIEVSANYKDLQTILLIEGGEAESNIVVKAGNGYAAVNDLPFTVGAGEHKAFVLDSARFMNVTGTARGKIVITSSAACQIAVIEIGVPAQAEPNA